MKNHHLEQLCILNHSTQTQYRTIMCKKNVLGLHKTQSKQTIFRSYSPKISIY